MKWWLISDEDVNEIKKRLDNFKIMGALHTLDSGLHETDEVPKDFREKKKD